MTPEQIHTLTTICTAYATCNTKAHAAAEALRDFRLNAFEGLLSNEDKLTIIKAINLMTAVKDKTHPRHASEYFTKSCL